MVEPTTEAYVAAIPKCCTYQTLKDHLDCLGLCWGLVRAIEREVPMDCSGCPLMRHQPQPGEQTLDDDTCTECKGTGWDKMRERECDCVRDST